MTFEFDAQRYQRASAHQQEWGQRLIAELDLQGHERILDVGSGDGSLTHRLAAGVPRGSVLGVDASAQMVAAAQKVQGPNLRFVRTDILDADFLEEFDVVFSSATLHWVKDHVRLLGVL
jgi:trans-aconitate methyltransferase